MRTLLFVLANAAIGWVCLFPARRRLGAWAYFSLSWPVGLLAWPVAAAICSLLGVPVKVPWIAAGTLLYAAATFASLRSASNASGEDAPVPWWGYLVHATVLAALAYVVARAQYSFITGDSWRGYDSLGILLFDTGRITVQLAAERNLLIPAMHAAYRAFGAETLVVAYPETALHLAAALLLALWRFSFARLRTSLRVACCVLIAGAMVAGDLFIYQSLYVHSHMVTAAFLFVAVLGLVAARRSDAGGERAWSIVAGLGAAGVALARPDGPIYAFVPAVLATAVLLERGFTLRRAAAFFGPLFAVTGIAFVAIFADLGMWRSDKLSGPMTLAQSALLLALPAIAAAVSRAPRLARWAARPRNVLGLALAVSALAVMGAAAVRTASFVQAVTFAYLNLTGAGQWTWFWWFAAGVIVLTVAFSPFMRGEASGELLYSILQFAAIALTIHGLTHPGRLGLYDSLNRIAFHIVPLVWWLAGSFLGVALYGVLRGGADERGAAAVTQET